MKNIKIKKIILPYELGCHFCHSQSRRDAHVY